MDHVIDELKVSERRACRVPGQHRSTQRKIAKIPDDEAALPANITAMLHHPGARYFRYAVFTSPEPIVLGGELREAIQKLSRRISKWADKARDHGIEVLFRGINSPVQRQPNVMPQHISAGKNLVLPNATEPIPFFITSTQMSLHGRNAA